MSEGKKNLEEQKQAWESNAVEASLKRIPERVSLQHSWGAPVERLHTPTEDPQGTYEEQLGFPGEYPFTRGVQPTMYRSRFWTMRQYAGFGNAKETNERFHYLLKSGQTGLSVAFDLPTQMGYDSDHPMARGEVGRTGVAIDSLKDMETLLDGLPIGKISTSMTINSTASVLLCMYIAVAEKQGIPWDQLRGTIQNDILKEYVARGTYIYPPAPSMRLITDIFAFCREQVPRWNPISISGYHIREAGATAVQEVAFTLAHAIAYVEAALEAGLEVDQFAPRLSFFFAAQNDLLEEVSKFRAARRLWARLMKNRFGAKLAKSCKLRFHTQTAGVTLTAQQPENNIVRVAIQALSAVLGGTQSLHTNSLDEAIALPTERSARIALRTQQIIAHESGAAQTVDPLAGSYYVESLTDQIEELANEYLDKIDQMGGAIKAIEAGFIQDEIAQSAYTLQKQIENTSRVVVGVNDFITEEPPLSGEQILRVDPAGEQAQVEALATLRNQERNQDAVEKALQDLSEAAKGEQNLLPFILSAVKTYATVGEISDILRKEFGIHRPSF
ncbi:MAG TPA: methylmalonyl-CoA mutase [Myxococcales bacterium]|nr:methylmalonyl-CoA mutase [Deltaproteobacteria bacterium]HAA54686.1 methylmalonyl-CoA mutase [Myxococcales bacterium]|tara:strand:+ start:4084 stop:5757 length:1674 start_codon:yes stop_codon:yes gene_type:complete